MEPSLNSARYNTSIAGWSFALANGLDSYGIDSRQLFLDAGIDLDAIDSAAQRLPVESVQQVWRFAEENYDEYFGIVVAQQLTPASFHALGFALWSSASLLDFLERLIRYRCVISHKFFCELLEEEQGYRLILVDERSLKSQVTHDTFMAYFLTMARQLLDPGYTPMHVRTSRPEEHSTARVQDFYRCDIETRTGESSMLLDRESLLQPLRYRDKDLAAQQDALVERYIGQFGLISEEMLKVRTEIHRLLSAGHVNIDLVAEGLNVTVRTLQRRLSAEKGSYNGLLDEVRQQLAMDYVKDPGANATEIAHRLGFSDSSSFGRSFKRWTKKSFTKYREDC
jgi:AraC-like DNA-binding protein